MCGTDAPTVDIVGCSYIKDNSTEEPKKACWATGKSDVDVLYEASPASDVGIG